jgi:D-alanyl-D-alanine carboxypeptidase-like protein
VYRNLTPGFGATPYMRGMIGNVPIGVVPSPSCRLRLRPFRPTRAVYGPATGRQQSPSRRHVRSVADVVRRRRALTVTSWVVVGATDGYDGHDAASAAATTWTASVIGAQSTLTIVAVVALVLAFVGTISPVRQQDVRFSYRSGCPVAPAELRLVRVTYHGFDGRAHLGALVVNGRVARDVVTVFGRLYAAQFPLRRMTPVSAFRGSDDASMAADNTSGFNCRRAVGGSGWSEHAYGTAIDVNPVENPYVLGDRPLPPAGRAFLDRRLARRGMAVRGGVLVRAFASIGWKWGGRWAASPDYQHFSLSGR